MRLIRLLPILWLVLSPPAMADDMAKARAQFENRAFEAAEETLRPLARAGNAEAELLLGDLYGLGLIPAAPSRATVFWQRAAFKGHPLAQLRLSRAYRTGTGVARDPLRAALWARLAQIGRAPLAAQAVSETGAALTPAQEAELDHLLRDLKPYLYPLAD